MASAVMRCVQTEQRLWSPVTCRRLLTTDIFVALLLQQLAIWCLNVNHEQRPSFDMVGRALATLEAMTQS